MEEEKIEKGEVTIKDIDLANLCHAVVHLTNVDVPKMEKESHDEEYIKLVKKARRYLNLVLDSAILRYTKDV